MYWFWAIPLYILMEILVNGIFHVLNKFLKPDERRSLSIFKGILERLFLVVGITIGYPHVIIAFGALKIGTRFQRDTKISNDYFLIGNFISLLGATVYSYFATQVIC